MSQEVLDLKAKCSVIEQKTTSINYKEPIESKQEATFVPLYGISG
jgi:hypothetical protein